MNSIIISKSANCYTNIAVEGYLLASQGDGITLYLWRNADTVVVGRNQNPYTEVNLSALLQGGKLARRRTGGGAVYHDEGNLNFSFIASNEVYDESRQLDVIIRALSQLGISVEKSGRNDLTIDGKKLSGNAYAHGKSSSLHHGTILIRTDSKRLSECLSPSKWKLERRGVKSVRARVVNLCEVDESINAESVADAIRECFELEYGAAKVVDFDDIAKRDEVVKDAHNLASDEWLYGNWQDFSGCVNVVGEWGEAVLNIKKEGKEKEAISIKIASDIMNAELIKNIENSYPYPVKCTKGLDSTIVEDIYNAISLYLKKER